MSSPTFTRGELEVLKLWRRVMNRLQKPHNTNHVRVFNDKGLKLFVNTRCDDEDDLQSEVTINLWTLRLMFKSTGLPWLTFGSRSGEQKELKHILTLARANCCIPDTD